MRNKKIIVISIICAILFAVVISAISINHIGKNSSKAAESNNFSKENIKNEQINVVKDNEINETRGDQKEETSEITSEEIVAENTEENVENAKNTIIENAEENTKEVELTNNDDNSNNYQNDENSDIEYSNSDNSDDEESNNDDSYEDNSNNESNNNSNHTHEHITEKPTSKEPKEDHVVYKADGSIDLNQSYWAEGGDAAKNCSNSKEMKEFKEYVAKKFQGINYYFTAPYGGKGPFSVYDLCWHILNYDTREKLIDFHFDGTKFVED